MELIIATRNQGKLREISSILSLPGLCLLSLRDFPDIPPAEENGVSFAENALIKARTAAHYSGLPALADDSGLEVDALEGRPGILSARYSGPAASDRQNIEKLLAEMVDVPDGRRQARFVCQAALVHQGRAYQAEGRLDGVILRQPRGQGGFGYDPIFLIPEKGLTAAELEPGEKNRISHRAQALRKLFPLLRNWTK
jgi:XTP/dITP diphosphohydrolase